MKIIIFYEHVKIKINNQNIKSNKLRINENYKFIIVSFNWGLSSLLKYRVNNEDIYSLGV